MKLCVERSYFADHSAEGALAIDERRFCHTLEDPVRAPGVKVYGETAIPFGRYRLGIRTSPLLKRAVLWVIDVRHFEYIYLHAANTPSQILGCIAVGYDPTLPYDARIANSRAAEDALFARVAPVIRRGEAVWLDVVGPTLRAGMGGIGQPRIASAVRVLQQWLRLEPRYQTGLYGPLTDEAVRAFQRSRGLKADGIAGRETWVALGEAA